MNRASNPRCPRCSKNMNRLWTSKRRQGDKKTHTPIGWVCMECEKVILVGMEEEK